MAPEEKAFAALEAEQAAFPAPMRCPQLSAALVSPRRGPLLSSCTRHAHGVDIHVWKHSHTKYKNKPLKQLKFSNKQINAVPQSLGER